MALYARYNMLADLYEQSNTVAPSGQRVRTWNYDQPVATIECVVRGPGMAGLRTVGSTERFGDEYEDIEWVRLRTVYPLDKRFRLGNIRTVDRWGDVTVHWKDFDNRPDTFEVMGVAASQDPWGRLVEYEVLAKKVDE